jgi:ABC-type uncharacterized transport system substrate-binding protein
MIRTRVVVAAVAVAFAAVVPAVAAGRARIAMIGPDETPRFADIARGLREGLAAHGHGAGDVQETRVPRGDRQAAVAGAAALAARKPDVVIVVGTEIARSVRDSAPELPIVFITPGDPVANGLRAPFLYNGVPAGRPARNTRQEA